MWLKKLMILEINTSIWFQLIENKEEAHSSEPQRHIPQVNLLLCHKIMAMCCFVWSLDLQLEEVRQALSTANYLLYEMKS